MLVNEVCKKCSLTKKAVEYYVEQGLIKPSVCENGYRNFSEEDVSVLSRISVLRGLGLSVADIRSVLGKTDGTALREVLQQKTLQIAVLQEKQKMLSELVEKEDWEEAESELRQLRKKQSVMERLLQLFPGNYGRYVCLHFAPYLNEPVVTKEQQEAFETIISFLDSTEFSLSEDVQKYLDEAAAVFDENFAQKVSASAHEVIRDTEKYIADNREVIESYLAYKQSEEYKSSPAYRLEAELCRFTGASGYNDIFIPAMCRLSSSYREYHKGLRKADEKFLKNFPACRREERNE